MDSGGGARVTAAAAMRRQKRREGRSALGNYGSDGSGAGLSLRRRWRPKGDRFNSRAAAAATTAAAATIDREKDSVMITAAVVRA